MLTTASSVIRYRAGLKVQSVESKSYKLVYGSEMTFV